jgi:hypothetical protein
MKTLASLFLLLIFLLSLPSFSQAQTSLQSAPIRSSMKRGFPSETPGSGSNAPVSSHFFKPLSASVLLPSGVDSLPINSTWSFQSNGRALHSMQIDPSNPSNIHAVITAMTDNSGKDLGSVSRRAMYTFSSDAGKHWTQPTILGKFRSGYADMKLFQRNGKYVPVIAAHAYVDATGNPTISDLWIEKGNPGDGNFAVCKGNDTIPATGYVGLIIWPSIAVSNDGKFVYMISSVSPATGGSPDQLQFGVWKMDAAQDSAVFQGWSAEPGSTDANNPGAGICLGGAYRIGVSQSGHIGVTWQNSASGNPSTDGSIYFSESTDSGKTWSSTIPTIASGPTLTGRTVADNASNTYAWTPSSHLDFWYDGDQPRLIYVGFYNDAPSYYLPYTSEIYYVPDAVEGDSIPVAIGELNASPGSLIVPNFINLGGNDVDLQELTTIQWITVARTADPKHFAVFYQSYVAGDTEVFSDDTGTVIFGYSSIFYSTTLDGGHSWSDPTPFMVNSGSASQKFDFRFPSVSDFNQTGATGITYHCSFAVDTAAGYVDSLNTPTTPSGVPGFDDIGYAHASVTASVDAVSENAAASSLQLTPNFPDPFASATTIQFTLTSESLVLLTVTDMLGRPVATLVNGRLGPGDHTAMFNAGDLPDGVYRYTLQANGVSVSKSMSHLR